ncbi:hypothetical protein VFA_002753 [Vibrio furnissii CIP 102972]|nr:hypothetical protein VFA_002753 [Vibrio furnissii CIP 102972]
MCILSTSISRPLHYSDDITHQPEDNAMDFNAKHDIKLVLSCWYNLDFGLSLLSKTASHA